MKLWTKAIAKKTPKLYATDETPVEDKMVTCKFFTPMSSWTWYVVEAEEQEDGDTLFFGYVDGLEGEWGYFSLNELESMNRGYIARIERDLYFDKKKFSDISR